MTKLAVLKLKDLKPGDLLLHHGSGTLDKVIRWFDPGNYNHAAIYRGKTNGKDFVESIPIGIVNRNLSNTSKESNFIHVFRFKKNGSYLGSRKYPVAPIKKVVNQYLLSGSDYGFSDILLLALIIHTRKIPRSIDCGLLTKILETAGQWIDTKLGQRETMICSSLIYRIYKEADLQKSIYNLEIDYQNHSNAKSLFSNKTQKNFPLLNQGPDMNTPEIRTLERALDNDLWKVNSTKINTTDVIKHLEEIRVDNFVTPNDLARSSSLKVVGTLDFAGRKESFKYIKGSTFG